MSRCRDETYVEESVGKLRVVFYLGSVPAYCTIQNLFNCDVVAFSTIEMNFEGTSREKFFYHNTLLCLVRSLQDKNITVDLRNDSYVCGQLVSVDGYMNLSFGKAVYCDTQQNEYYFDDLFIQARNIRYVHIPETMSILGNIKNELRRKVKNQDRKTVVKSRKATKALQQHLKTVAELDN